MQKYAIISVSDTSGIAGIAKVLIEKSYKILATTGTKKFLSQNGIESESIETYTNSPEMFSGRVKTLHPKIHGGILFKRDKKEDAEDAEKNGINPIDIVIVNLYPFKKKVASKSSREECIENIDIGGVSLIRSAAKNSTFVTVVTNPNDYEKVSEALKNNGVNHELRTDLLKKAFQHTADYDTAIANYLCGDSESYALPTLFPIKKLRYGENPHQKALLYGDIEKSFKQLHGKDLSYNNMLDMSAARGLIREFENDAPTVAVLKHTNPCGVGTASALVSAWEKAYATDKTAPFGGVVVSNKKIDEKTAKKLSELFLEIVLAPDFEKKAFEILSQKKNIRLVAYSIEKNAKPAWLLRSIGNELTLGEDDDVVSLDEKNISVVSKRKPSKKEKSAMFFAWKVAKHVKSNAIVFASHDRTLGIGAGQMSRVDATKIAVMKAKDSKLSLKSSAVASDAFLPFADTVKVLSKSGATALIQPGGSIRDEEVKKEADKLKIAMLFTGVRHFRH